MSAPGRPEAINAVTLGVSDMARSVGFYLDAGFEIEHGGADEPFTTFVVGPTYLNLQLVDAEPETKWGRFIVHVDDVDAMYARMIAAGWTPDFAPSDAPWGERYFHIPDPDGHEVSFAKRLPG